MDGPKPGEFWKVASYEPLKYLGIARDLIQEKYLVFADDKGPIFIVSKDDFWAADFPKEKVG